MALQAQAATPSASTRGRTRDCPPHERDRRMNQAAVAQGWRCSPRRPSRPRGGGGRYCAAYYEWASGRSRGRRSSSRSAATASCCRRCTAVLDRRRPVPRVRHEPRHRRLPDERISAPTGWSDRIDRAKPSSCTPLQHGGGDGQRASASSSPRSTRCRCCARRARPRRSKSRSTGACVMSELACDGVLVATPAGLDRLQSVGARPDPAARSPTCSR
jgi:hypothetical protein